MCIGQHGSRQLLLHVQRCPLNPEMQQTKHCWLCMCVHVTSAHARDQHHVVDRSEGVINKSAAGLAPLAAEWIGWKVWAVSPLQSHEALSGSGCLAASAGFAASDAGLAASIARAGLPPNASDSRSRSELVKVPMPAQDGGNSLSTVAANVSETYCRVGAVRHRQHQQSACYSVHACHPPAACCCNIQVMQLRVQAASDWQ
jgi:hypothetical protein